MKAEEPRATMASDVYSFAMTAIVSSSVIAYMPQYLSIYTKEIITGEVPFYSTYPRNEQVMVNVCMKNIRPERPSCEECSDQFWDLMSICWRTDPSSRRTMEKTGKELKAIAKSYRPLRILSTGTCDSSDLDIDILTSHSRS